MPQDNLLSIIVVSYNTKNLLLDCLRSVRAETRAPYELVVIDNASDDGSADAVAAEFPEAVLLAETVNHGFARANNIAARHASGDRLLLLNPDTVILDGALDRLLEFARSRPTARIWGGRTLFGDHSLNPSSCWRRLSLWNVFCRTTGLTGLFPNSNVFNAEAYGGWDRSTVREVDIITGCMFLISRADWETLGGFDKTFVMYGEEADLCLRARHAIGARPVVTPEATIIHYGGASERVAADKMVRLMRAKTELIERHLPPARRGITRRLFVAWPFTRALTCTVAARLGRISPERAATWTAVWNRRDEWKHGFSAKDGV